MIFFHIAFLEGFNPRGGRSVEVPFADVGTIDKRPLGADEKRTGIKFGRSSWSLHGLFYGLIRVQWLASLLLGLLCAFR